MILQFSLAPDAKAALREALAALEAEITRLEELFSHPSSEWRESNEGRRARQWIDYVRSVTAVTDDLLAAGGPDPQTGEACSGPPGG